MVALAEIFKKSNIFPQPTPMAPEVRELVRVARAVAQEILIGLPQIQIWSYLWVQNDLGMTNFILDENPLYIHWYLEHKG